MSLEDLTDDVAAANADLRDIDVELDRETRTELAMLVAALDPEEPAELVRRGLHVLFQSAVDTGKLDFHLRSEYDVTYDEYLMGMTMDTYEEQQGVPQDDDERHYQF